ELGPGTGGTTRALLRAMEPGSTLLCIEINATFVAFIQRIPDPRLRVFEGSAEHLGDALAAWGLEQPAAIVSGIPFSTMPLTVARRVLRAAETAMAPGGRFVAYQVRSRVHTLGTEVFGAAAMEVEFLNIPPMRIYQWCKANGGRRKAESPAVRGFRPYPGQEHGTAHSQLRLFPEPRIRRPAGAPATG
ncbi:MAG TPA: hypothetical protein VK997_14690, partial [Deferrisomatales bacterium]|nr:hypothetical protein [Deferrisomatales bacterium]